MRDLLGLRVQVLEREEDLAAFKSGYDGQIAARSGGSLASVVQLDYLRAASRPMGCFDRAGRMIAGWVIQERAPLIVLRAMSAGARAAFLAEVDRSQLLELTAIWRNDGISGDAFAALLWPRIIAECVTRGRPRILGIGYRNPMNEIYGRMGPRLIYHGPSQTLADTEVFVYCYSRASLCATYLSNIVGRKLAPAGARLLRALRPERGAAG
ncbi:MAG: hypothetical protein R3B09_07045 [Nannocystaceae bacterium]